jgi:hypothetical protein
VNTDLRASLIASGAAALLSAIVGAVSAVAFLPLLLRAILGGLVIGGIVFGAFALARRFMPELFGETEDSPSADSGLGTAVDIVLPAEEPELGADKEDLGSLESAEASAPAVAPDLAASPESSLGTPKGGEPAPRGPAPAVYEDDFGGESLLDGPEGASPAEGAELPSFSDAPLRDGLEDLDVLPDLDSLSDSFAESPSPARTENADERRGAYGFADGKASASGAAGSDPALLAQAVRTLLKRDQKG